MEITIKKADKLKEKPLDEGKLGFGRVFTDHMFMMQYDKGQGWHDAQIVPYAPFPMDPACQVFHYAQECFEGMKAYRRADGKVQLFRPEKNAQRMISTHERLCIPEIPEEDFVQAVKALVALDADWVPHSENTSLYIRPCTIATEPVLGVKPSDQYIFFIICAPSGPYYAEGLDPVKIFVEDSLTRSAPGGTGYIKCGGNYAASLAGQMKAHELGFSQVLWLDGVERRYVEEVGSMNVFFVLNDEIWTAPTDGTVLPGITRMSCIELLKDWGYRVREEKLAIDDLIAAAHAGKLKEVFGTGTAAVVSPVKEIRYKDQDVQIGDGHIGPITGRLYDTLTGIQYGKMADQKGWIVAVD